MQTRRPEWRPASKTQTRRHFLKRHHAEMNISPPYISCLNQLLFFTPSASHPSCVCLQMSSFYPHRICPVLFFSLFAASPLCQSLLGIKEPLPIRDRRSLQLLGAVVPEDPSVLPEEFWQRGLASSEWPLLLFLSREPQVIHAQNSASSVRFRLWLTVWTGLYPLASCHPASVENHRKEGQRAV